MQKVAIYSADFSAHFKVYCLLFNVPLKNISLIWRHHHDQWRAANLDLCSALGAFWSGKNLFRATPAVTRGLGFSGLIRRTAAFSRFLRHIRGCGGSILTRILTGSHFKAVYLLFHAFFHQISFIPQCLTYFITNLDIYSQKILGSTVDVWLT
jgi:hypothetical protein